MPWINKWIKERKKEKEKRQKGRKKEYTRQRKKIWKGKAAKIGRRLEVNKKVKKKK